MNLVAAMPPNGNYNRNEILAGIFVLIAIFSLIYFAIGLGNWKALGAGGYIVYADFVSASGLNVGDPVEIAGVEVGHVESIKLSDYQARVDLRIKDDVTIRRDAIASLEREGLIGDRLVSVEPGTSDKPLGPGDEIKETESPLSLQEWVVTLVAGDLIPGE